MSPFRLRGRNRDSAAPDWPSTEPDHEETDWAAGFPATGAARPLAVPTDDPPTDPYGWPPVPDPATPVVARSTAFDRAWPLPEPDAAALPTAADGARSAAPLPRAPGSGPRVRAGRQLVPGPPVRDSRHPTRPRRPGWRPRSRSTTCPGTRTTWPAAVRCWPATCANRAPTRRTSAGPEPGRQRAELAVPGRICADPRGGCWSTSGSGSRRTRRSATSAAGPRRARRRAARTPHRNRGRIPGRCRRSPRRRPGAAGGASRRGGSGCGCRCCATGTGS